MAWDKDRPYLPIDQDGTPSTQDSHSDYSHTFPNPKRSDITKMYEDGFCEIVECGHTTRFTPFKHVRMSVMPVSVFGSLGRSGGCVICETDKSRHMSMFASEFERIMRTIRPTRLPIDGFWSAEKKGRMYGITLDELAEGDDAR